MSPQGSRQNNDHPDWQTVITSIATSLQNQLAPVAQFVKEHQNDIMALYLSAVPSIKDLRTTQLKGHFSFDNGTLDKLMEHGWYLNPSLSLISLDLLVEAFDEDPVGASEMFANQVESEVSQIQDSLESGFSNRRDILHQAFYAHRTKLYNLSVPVFLAQADGIWRDHLGRHLFDQGGPTKAADEYEQQISDDMIRSILDSFTVQVPLWVSQSLRGPNFNDLNRHQVLHGESVDYGTREYSLKAISFLYFIAFVLESGSVAADGPS